MNCSHISSVDFEDKGHAKLQSTLHEDCGYCFVNCESEAGLFVCLTCFQTYCSLNHHAQLHQSKKGHALFLWIQRNKTVKKEEDIQSSKKMKISEETHYDVAFRLSCLVCDKEPQDASSSNLMASPLIQSILQVYKLPIHIVTESFDEPTISCEHVAALQQEDLALRPGEEKSHCSACGQKDNLWLCLSCGDVGCGRRQLDGSGGLGHAFAHWQQHSHHALSCKLGTLSSDLHANPPDIYCYHCDELRKDDQLQAHLARLGLSLSTLRKTELSLAELESQRNHTLALSSSEAGDETAAKPLSSAAGLVGIRNLGNSCYMASILQSSFHLAPFYERYACQADLHICQCTSDPFLCFSCQLGKIGKGLALQGASSGSLSPKTFKALVGRHHREFSSTRQQDAFEFWEYYIKQLKASESSQQAHTADAFAFTLAQKLTCSLCAHAQLTRVPSCALSLSIIDDDHALPSPSLLDCLDRFMAPESVSYRCAKCQQEQSGLKQYFFASLPAILLVHMQRFTHDTAWQPVKKNTPVKASREPPLDLTCYRLSEQDTRIEEEEEEEEKQVDAQLLQSVLAMGFTEAGYRAAIRALQQASLLENRLDAVIAWLCEHPEQGGGPTGEEKEALEAIVMAMGFSSPQAKRGLQATNYDPDRAIDWILSHSDTMSEDKASVTLAPSRSSYRLESYILHKGTSAHCGHYTAHVWQSQLNGWVTFNDERVTFSAEPCSVESAYLYFYVACLPEEGKPLA